MLPSTIARRERAIHLVCTLKLNRSDAAKELSCSKGSIDKLLLGVNTGHHRTYTDDQRTQLVAQAKSLITQQPGVDVKTIARQMDLKYSTLIKWLNNEVEPPAESLETLLAPKRPSYNPREKLAVEKRPRAPHQLLPTTFCW